MIERAMLTPLLLLVALAAPRGTVSPADASAYPPSFDPSSPATQPDGAEHGKLTWFTGSFDDLVREATKSNRVIFIDFWTTWCVWCKRLDQDTFTNDAVAATMKDVLCYSVDAESQEGAPLARRFAANGYPLLIFLDPDGSLRDRISGYLPPDRFQTEVERIKRGEGTVSEARKRLAKVPSDVFARLDLVLALRKTNDLAGAKTELDTAKKAIANGQGFDPKSVDDRWKLVEKLNAVGEAAGAREQMAAIKSLDPECKTVVCRRIKLQEITHEANLRYAKTKSVDTTSIVAFLKTETQPEILFEGWNIVQNMELYQVRESHKAEHADEEVFHRTGARDAGREAWKYCPPDKIADWGARFAAFLYECGSELTPEEKDLAVAVATRASEAAPNSPDHLEVLGCCLFAAGKRDEAVRTIQRGLAIDPNRASLKNRLAEFQR
jgi:thioredoxin-related protein